MTHHVPIRRRRDGSIDTASYMAGGRVHRAESARHLATLALHAVRRAGAGAMTVALVLVALLPVLGGLL